MGDGTGTRLVRPCPFARAVAWPVLRAGFEARARLTWAFFGGFTCLWAAAALFLRDGRASLARREEAWGFRDVGRADRRSFFLFKSFSL
jgi:hypothetical protein